MILALYLLFIGLNISDLFFTVKILSAGGYEANPIVQLFYLQWGFAGIYIFKLLFSLFVGLLTFLQYFMELELIAANIVYVVGVLFLYQQYKKIKVL